MVVWSFSIVNVAEFRGSRSFNTVDCSLLENWLYLSFPSSVLYMSSPKSGRFEKHSEEEHQRLEQEVAHLRVSSSKLNPAVFVGVSVSD